MCRRRSGHQESEESDQRARTAVISGKQARSVIEGKFAGIESVEESSPNDSLMSIALIVLTVGEREGVRAILLLNPWYTGVS